MFDDRRRTHNNITMKRGKSSKLEQSKKLKSVSSESNQDSTKDTDKGGCIVTDEENDDGCVKLDKENCESVSVEIKSMKKPCYENYFRYDTQNNEKVRICLLCEKKSISKAIKRKNSNTTGLRSHLKMYHHDEFKQMFPDEKDGVSAQQTTLQSFLSVS